ncbi:MAG: F0F1 ATP synthase subunit A [Chloroflexi bacterium]|nr:F0F1 ATP synthase subunit A [Chloroflexota bacterium]
MEIHLEIFPHELFTIPILGGLPITNTLLTSWIAIAVLVAFALVATRDMRLVPTGVQNAAESIIELLLGLGEQAAGPRARAFLPLVATLFLYIWIANWIGILPGVGSIPALRSANSDLSITVAMALIVFVSVQVAGLRANWRAYLLKFVWPPFIGQMEILAEVARPVSLAFRLFGNILAGYVLVEVWLQLVPPVVPAIFLGLELGVGLVQALIFAILALAFLSLATAHGHTSAEAEATAH